MSTIPATIGRYEVQRLIAGGGMGRVYLASDPVLRRQVAIKVLQEVDDDDLRERFTREARAAAGLRHRNIVTIFDIGEHEGHPFMAMEYVQGQTLRSLVRSDPPPSAIRRLEIVEALCDGLAFAHARGIIHRDIKPANLVVDSDGVLKILDFGIARAATDPGVTKAGHLVGSLNYMSPEQVMGSALDPRSDMFAVGLVLYELFARREAFPGGDASVLTRILQSEPEPLETICPTLDPEIPAIVRRALQKEPDRRFSDLAEMRDAIARVRRGLEAAVALDDEPAPDPAGSSASRPDARHSGLYREEIARRRTQQIEDHVAAGRLALAAGDPDEAIARCEQALLLDPNDLRALDVVEQARRLRDETSARARLTQAREELRQGDLTAASGHVRAALVLVPEFPEGVELSRVIAETRLAQERERHRAEAVAGHLAGARAALDRDDPAAARRASEEALEADPGHTEALRIRARAEETLAAQARRADAERLAAAASADGSAAATSAEGTAASTAAEAPTTVVPRTGSRPLAGTATAAAPASPREPAVRTSHRSLWPYAAAAALVLLVLIGIAMALRPADETPVAVLGQIETGPDSLGPSNQPATDDAGPPSPQQGPRTDDPQVPPVGEPEREAEPDQDSGRQPGAGLPRRDETPAGPAVPATPPDVPDTTPPSIVPPPVEEREEPAAPSPSNDTPPPPAGARAAETPDPVPPDVPSTRAAAPAAPAPDDRAQIAAVLEQYVEAFRALDVAAIERIYPTVPAQVLRGDFARAREYRVHLIDPQIAVSGPGATVTSVVETELLPRSGSPQRSRRPMTFTLERRAGGWVITGLR